MTSTNINVGIEGRSSSRILKPPGGAHTDIFGKPQEKVEITTSRYSKQAQKSSINECFGYDRSPIAAPKQVLMKEINEPTKMEVSANGLKNGSTPVEDENTKPAATVPVPPTTQRVRVPPGGFSSGLW